MQNKYYTGKGAAVLWFSIVRRDIGFSEDILSAHAASSKLSRLRRNTLQSLFTVGDYEQQPDVS